MFVYKKKNISRILTKLSILSLFMIFAISSYAQTDPIFTQYMNSMQTVNPAYAGMWDKVGFQVFSRRYYVGQNRAPLTNSVIFYSPIKNENNGIGLNITDDKLGYQKRLGLTVDYAYQIRLDWKTNLRLGIKAGFLNFDNLLSDYLLFPDGFSDPNFQDDVDIKFMPQWGIGGILYSKDYFVSLSIPQLITNSFKTNRNNYSSLAELRYAYLIAGYFFGRQRQVRFKPTIMVKTAKSASIQADIAANFLFFDKFWIGGMYRTNHTFAVLAQFIMMKNIHFGYAIDYPLSRDIHKYQYGTHEFRVVYEYDFYRRPYTQKHYF